MYINTNIISRQEAKAQPSVQNITDRKGKHLHDEHLSYKEFSALHYQKILFYQLKAWFCYLSTSGKILSLQKLNQMPPLRLEHICQFIFSVTRSIILGFKFFQLLHRPNKHFSDHTVACKMQGIMHHTNSLWHSRLITSNF